MGPQEPPFGFAFKGVSSYSEFCTCSYIRSVLSFSCFSSHVSIIFAGG